MISIYSTYVSSAKVTDLPVVSVCSLGVLRTDLTASGLPGISAVRSAGLPGLTVLPVLTPRNERPIKALEAGEAAAQAQAYAFAAASAGTSKRQTSKHHKMWAFRGLEPWSDPA